MEWVETTGRTVEDAEEAALDQLGVDHADAEFEVVEEPKAGLFGRMRNEARVRARVRPSVPRPKDDRRDRRRRRDAGGSDAPPDDQLAEASAPAQVLPAALVDDPPRPAGTVASAGGDLDATGNGADRSDGETLERQAEHADEFLRGLLVRFGLLGEVTKRQVDDDTVEVAVTGDDLGLLFGPKGATLNAVQELTRSVAQRQGVRVGRLLVDVDGYREKRRVALERFTREISAAVLSSGTPRALEPMQAADRKVVHDTVNDVDGVVSRSEGEDPTRRVVILPDRG